MAADTAVSCTPICHRTQLLQNFRHQYHNSMIIMLVILINLTFALLEFAERQFFLCHVFWQPGRSADAQRPLLENRSALPPAVKPAYKGYVLNAEIKFLDTHACQHSWWGASVSDHSMTCIDQRCVSLQMMYATSHGSASNIPENQSCTSCKAVHAPPWSSASPQGNQNNSGSAYQMQLGMKIEVQSALGTKLAELQHK